MHEYHTQSEHANVSGRTYHEDVGGFRNMTTSIEELLKIIKLQKQEVVILLHDTKMMGSESVYHSDGYLSQQATLASRLLHIMEGISLANC